MAIAAKARTGPRLPLDTLEIKGYRGFKELTIPKLARVNLITGKNNVGKTSLLEAVNLFARRGSPGSVWHALSVREPALIDGREVPTGELLDYVLRMFHDGSGFINWASDGAFAFETTIGNLPQASTVSARLTIAIARPRPEANDPVGLHTSFVRSAEDKYDTGGLTYALARIWQPDRSIWERQGATNCVFLGSAGVQIADLGALWDNIALTQAKIHVIDALHIIASEIEDIALTGEVGEGIGRVPNVRLAGEFIKHPLSQFGDGVNRLFGLFTAFANCTSGLLLVDEIENGLHYTALTSVWKTIFDLADRLNVQVFATTHSWECIEAFKIAVQSSDANDGEIIRLRDRNGGIEATEVGGEDLITAVEHQIEVR
jgi:hypothetical protein